MFRCRKNKIDQPDCHRVLSHGLSRVRVPEGAVLLQDGGPAAADEEDPAGGAQVAQGRLGPGAVGGELDAGLVAPAGGGVGWVQPL